MPCVSLVNAKIQSRKSLSGDMCLDMIVATLVLQLSKLISREFRRVEWRGKEREGLHLVANHTYHQINGESPRTSSLSSPCILIDMCDMFHKSVLNL